MRHALDVAGGDDTIQYVEQANRRLCRSGAVLPRLGPAVAAFSAPCVAKGQPQEKLSKANSQDRLAVMSVTD
jgi:hypothetical protein